MWFKPKKILFSKFLTLTKKKDGKKTIVKSKNISDAAEKNLDGTFNEFKTRVQEIQRFLEIKLKFSQFEFFEQNENIQFYIDGKNNILDNLVDGVYHLNSVVTFCNCKSVTLAITNIVI